MEVKNAMNQGFEVLEIPKNLPKNPQKRSIFHKNRFWEIIGDTTIAK